MSKVAVRTNKAPPPRPIFNQAIIANGFVFCSGQVGKDANGKTTEGTVQDRTVSQRSCPSDRCCAHTYFQGPSID